MGKLVEAARGYLGVKYRHRGRSRNGVDCAGLLVMAYRDCGIETSDFVLYGRTPFKDGIVTHTTAALGPHVWPQSPSVPMELQDGDVLVMRFERDPHHMGLVASVMYGNQASLNIIHAEGHTGRVLEQRLTPDMVARITHVFRKGVE